MEESRFMRNGPADAAATLVVAHGAGAAMDSDFMEQMAQNIAQKGIRVVRFEFPYMHKRRLEGSKKPPDRMPILEQTWKDVIAAVGGKHLFIGGKSMGGRVASMIADEAGVSGLICLGYPFHPPGKPEKLRTEHLENLRTPTLILQGERDTFGKREEVATYTLSDQIHVSWLADGDHSLKPRKKSGLTLEQNLEQAGEQAARFILDLVVGQ